MSTLEQLAAAETIPLQVRNGLTKFAAFVALFSYPAQVVRCGPRQALWLRRGFELTAPASQTTARK